MLAAFEDCDIGDTESRDIVDTKKLFPDAMFEVSDTTVLRWMHACNAMYGRHQKGFTDRRNDADVAQEFHDYCITMRRGNLQGSAASRARRARMYRFLYEKFPTQAPVRKAAEKWKAGEAVGVEGTNGNVVKLPPAALGDGVLEMIKKMFRVVKTHRNLIDMDFKVCST